MKKREFLKLSGVMAAGAMLSPLMSCKGESESGAGSYENGTANGKNVAASEFELPELPYPADALQPHIDRQTMQIHHGKHHAGYVRKLNAALEGSDYSGMSLEEIIKNVKPEDLAVRRNGGGHYNHSMYWRIMNPDGGGTPSGDLADAINAEFGSYDQFKQTFSDAAGGRFGSGWAWLSVKNDGKLMVSSTANQDNPLMAKIAEETGSPIMGIDVWEHAYYLKYQNERGSYVESWFNLINWPEVAANFKRATG